MVETETIRWLSFLVVVLILHQGGKDSLALKIDTVLAFCDEMCLKDRASIQEDGNPHHKEFGLIQPMSGRRLSKAVHTP